MAEGQVVKSSDDEFAEAFGQAVAAVVSGAPLQDAPPIDKDANQPSKSEGSDGQTVSSEDGKTAKAKESAGEGGQSPVGQGGDSGVGQGEGSGQGDDGAALDQDEGGNAKGSADDGSAASKSGAAPPVTAEDFAKLNEKLDKALTKEPQGRKEEVTEPQAPIAYEYSEDEKKVLAEYEKEWDEHAKVLSIREKKLVHDLEQKFVQALDVVLAELNKGLAPVLENTVSLSRERHFSAIRDAHRDYEELKEPISKWIDQHPAYLRDAMRKVYDEGDTKGTIDLIERYKKETGKQTTSHMQTQNKGPQVVKDIVSEAKVAATAPVQARRTVVQTSGVDPNDYDAAWKEAVG
jgi:hypothetical protein